MGIGLVQRRGLWTAVREYLARVKQDLRAAFQANFSPLMAGILSASLDIYLAMEKLRSFWTIHLTDFVRTKQTTKGFELDFSEIEAKINSSTRELLSAWYRRITSLFPLSSTERADVQMILELATPLRFSPEQRAAIKLEALQELAEQKGVPQELIPSIMQYRNLSESDRASLWDQLKGIGLSDADIQTLIGYGSAPTAEPPSAKLSFSYMTPQAQQAFINELKKSGIDEVEIEALVSAATFRKAQLSLPKVVEEHPEVYPAVVISISEADDKITVQYLAKGYEQREVALSLSDVRQVYPDVSVGDVIKIEHSEQGVVATEKHIAPGEHIRQFAPLFSGTFTDSPTTRPSQAFLDWANEVAEEQGLDISKFSESQRESWNDQLTAYI